MGYAYVGMGIVVFILTVYLIYSILEAEKL